jgi:hypothetical protein
LTISIPSTILIIWFAIGIIFSFLGWPVERVVPLSQLSPQKYDINHLICALKGEIAAVHAYEYRCRDEY